MGKRGCDIWGKGAGVGELPEERHGGVVEPSAAVSARDSDRDSDPLELTTDDALTTEDDTTEDDTADDDTAEDDTADDDTAEDDTAEDDTTDADESFDGLGGLISSSGSSRSSGVR